MEQSHQSISRTVGQHLQPLPMYPSIAQRDHERLTLTERDVTNKQHPKSWKVTSCSTSCTKWKPRNDGGASGCAANCRTCGDKSGVRCAAAGADGGSGSDGVAKCVAAPAPAAATPGTARPCPRPAGDWSCNAGPCAAAGAPGGAGRGMAEAAGDRVAEKCASTPRRGGGLEKLLGR